MHQMEQLKNECLTCTECSLCQKRTQVVFGVGNPESKLMFIGEGPGEREDALGEPFVGRAGQLLDIMLELIDLDRSRVYIANIVKCRPPQNRDPFPEEQLACRHWLDAQLEIVQPKLIVCLGRIAAGAMIKNDFRITREHGQWFEAHGAKIMAIYHPAALLRDEGKRPETFADLRILRDQIRIICPELYA